MSIRSHHQRLARLEQAQPQTPAAEPSPVVLTPDVTWALDRVAAWANGGPAPTDAEARVLGMAPEILRDFYLDQSAAEVLA